MTYSYAAGTTTCTLSSSSLSANGAGTCLITATKAADGNYNQVLSAQSTITFATGSTSTNVTIAVGTLVFRQTKSISATSSVAGRLTFRANNVVIPGCKNLVANAANSYTRTCSYKPSTRGYVTITASFNPTNPAYQSSTATSSRVFVTNRSGGR